MQVYFRFRSEPDFERIVHDVTVATLFDVKREVVRRRKLRYPDFELQAFEVLGIPADGSDLRELPDESQVIHPCTSILFKRIPVPKQCKGCIPSLIERLRHNTPLTPEQYQHFFLPDIVVHQPVVNV